MIRADVLKQMVQRIAAAFHAEKIILFGSYASGEATDDSDVDLLVVVSHSDDKPAQRAMRAYRCLRGLMVPTDILVKTPAEVDRFHPVHASLESEILERGRVLYG